MMFYNFFLKLYLSTKPQWLNELAIVVKPIFTALILVTTPPPEEIYLFIQNAQLFLAAYIKSLNHNSKFKNVECLALNRDTRLTWWCMLLIPAFETQRQIDL